MYENFMAVSSLRSRKILLAGQWTKVVAAMSTPVLLRQLQSTDKQRTVNRFLFFITGRAKHC